MEVPLSQASCICDAIITGEGKTRLATFVGTQPDGMSGTVRELGGEWQGEETVLVGAALAEHLGVSPGDDIIGIWQDKTGQMTTRQFEVGALLSLADSVIEERMIVSVIPEDQCCPQVSPPVVRVLSHPGSAVQDAVLREALASSARAHFSTWQISTWHAPESVDNSQLAERWHSDTDKTEAIIGQGLATAMGLAVGDKLVLTMEGKDGQLELAMYRVKDIFSFKEAILDTRAIFVRPEPG
ncbi:MAG: hypothetical protein HN348_36510 [Proteobacteria bacterium]|nr:hypothetical protein [Pseudomonadota bacterium]